MPEKLLVVDDEKSVLTFCERVLSRQGYEVKTALSGEEALALLHEERFDLLATDIHMPGLSGLELIQKALTIQPDLAVIVITGLGTLDISIQALRVGAHDFVTKPFTAADLSQAVGYGLMQARHAKERARLRLLEPLLELSQEALYHRDVAQLGDSIIKVAVSYLDAAGALLWLADTGEVFLKGQWPKGIQEWFAPRAFKVAGDKVQALDPQAWWPQTILWEDPQHMPRSLVHAPLEAPTGIMGSLWIAMKRPVALIDQSELDMVAILARQAAALLENARLVARLEDWNRTLEERVQQRTRELQEAQERLLRAERLATVGQLGSSIAHELRNPLGVISNAVYYLRGRLQGADEKVLKHLDIIEREVRASNKIISDLMNFVRVSNLTIRSIAPEELLRSTLERAQIPPHIKVKMQVTQGLGPLWVDVDKMQQVFLNLIDNAIQAMPNGGQLNIRVWEDDSNVVFAFEDRGEGIAPENLTKIFEPLFTTKMRGIGLGLSIVKMLVEAHGGGIRVTNNPEGGATFTVVLPKDTPIPTQKDVHSSEASDGDDSIARR